MGPVREGTHLRGLLLRRLLSCSMGTLDVLFQLSGLLSGFCSTMQAKIYSPCPPLAQGCIRTC